MASLSLIARETKSVVCWGAWLIILISLTGTSQAETQKRKRPAGNRFIRVSVADSKGKAVQGAEIVVQDAASKAMVGDQKYTVDADGAVWIVVRTEPPVELVVAAAGRVSAVQPVNWEKEYEITLYAKGEAFSMPAFVAIRTAPEPPPARKARVFSVMVENLEGARLKDATVSAVDTETKKIIEQKLLSEGFGTLEFSVEETRKVEIVAAAPGLVSESKPAGNESSYVFKLKRGETSGQVEVAVKNPGGDPLPNASLVMSVDGQDLPAILTDDRGTAMVKVTYRDPASLKLRAGQAGYQSFQTLIRLPRDQQLEIVLKPETRFVSVVVEDGDGNRLRDAQVDVVGVRDRKILESKALADGFGILELKVEPGQELDIAASAAGRLPAALRLEKDEKYLFKLLPMENRGSIQVWVKDKGGETVPGAKVSVVEGEREVAVAMSDEKGVAKVEFVYRNPAALALKVRHALYQPKDTQIRLPSEKELEVALDAQMRVLNAFVEGMEGGRVRNAEVSVVDKNRQRVLLPWVVLKEGFGRVEFSAAAGKDAEILARAPGCEDDSRKIGQDEASILIQLKRKETAAKLRVMVKDKSGKGVSNAMSGLVTGTGQELGGGFTDEQGKAVIAYSYKELTEARLEVRHGAYGSVSIPVRFEPEQDMEIVLLPEVPKERRTMAVILVLSKTLGSPPETYVQVKEGVHRILQDCGENTQLWEYVGIYTLGNRMVRDVLPFTRKLDAELAKQAEERLRDFNPYAGGLTWRDMEELGKFLEKTGRVSDAGCDVLVLAPKNMALKENESLLDSGGEKIMDQFRSLKLRLRLVEIGIANSKTQAYQELCDGTFGYYDVLPIGGSVGEMIQKLQYHYPRPPR